MQKSELRKQALNARLALSDEEYARLNKRLLGGFKTLDFSKIMAVHMFLPIKSKKEPDTFLLIDWLKEFYPHIKILISATNFKDHSMRNYLYEDRSQLLINKYGIPEPGTNSKYVSEQEISPDLVLVPLLAFDERGYRVGYGKGFYDRFLENSHAFRLGISFFKASTEINDVHLKDLKLDACLTPEGIIYF